MVDVPPIAGNIILVRDLFLRAKSSACVVQETKNFFHEDKTKVRLLYLYSCFFFQNHFQRGDSLIKLFLYFDLFIIYRQALIAYENFYKDMSTYENDTFSKWLREVIEVEGYLLQQPLLVYNENKLVSTFNVREKKLS